MENQHRKIKGYRDLSQEEIDLMNRIKEQGEMFRGLLVNLRQLRESQSENIESGVVENIDTGQICDSVHACDLAEDHLKTGVMWLVRAVALPNSF